jgi:diguanylate cyclase (GGDEF)-like protein
VDGSLALPRSGAHARHMPLLFALGMGLFGAAINLQPLPLGAGMFLLLGNFACLVVAARLHARYALLSALIAATPVLWQWGHAGALLVFGLEALVVAVLRGRGMRIFHADMLFWLLLGMPLTALVIRATGIMPLDYVLSICLKLGLNGMLYSALAALVVMFLEPSLARSWWQQPRVQHGLRDRLVYALSLITALTMLGSSLLITRQLVHYQEALIAKSLDETAGHLSRRMADYVGMYVKSIDLIADVMTHFDPGVEQLQQVLVEHQGIWKGFITMLVTDRNGRVIAAAPQHSMDAIGNDYSVADREYFTAAMASDRPFVSEVFQGRGFGADPIVAISKAWHGGHHGERLGVVEGSLNVGMLAEVAEPGIAGTMMRVLLLDQHGKVVHASKELGLTVLATLQPPDLGNDARGRKVIRLADSAGAPVEYLYSTLELDNGWRIYALMDYREIIRSLGMQYVGIFLIMALAVALAMLLTDRSGRRLTAPLEQIARDLVDSRRNPRMSLAALSADAAPEIAAVHAELERNMLLVLQREEHLEAEVAQRTRELESANRLLRELASEDALTGLSNRRVMDDQFPMLRATVRRRGALLAFIVIDIDHFKRLNDSYGHLAGDRCLVEIAAVLKQAFRRETDVIARFGGEEFALAVDCPSLDVLQKKIEQLRGAIAALVMRDEQGRAITVTASFGVLVAKPDFSVNINDWMRVADSCLYRAKAAGRNTVVIETA